MKAYVYVSLKKSVLDPQGKTIYGALSKIGYKGLHDVRQGKYFEITLNGGITRDEANIEVEKIARPGTAGNAFGAKGRRDKRKVQRAPRTSCRYAHYRRRR